MTIGGVLAIRNGDSLDYCWREAALSLLAICQKVIIADCESSDGTREAIHEWMGRDKRIKTADYKWTDPRGTNLWWPEFQNYARELVGTEWVVLLDADEILHENSHDSIRDSFKLGCSLVCRRWNFWRDAQSTIPSGKCCGSEVIRVGPANLWFPSDYPDPRAKAVCDLAVPDFRCEIMHYGFLRKREAFFRKAKEVQRIWNDNYDPRLEAADQAGGNWMANEVVADWINDLVPFTGTHPEIIKPWLRARNYEC